MNQTWRQFSVTPRVFSACQLAWAPLTAAPTRLTTPSQPAPLAASIPCVPCLRPRISRSNRLRSLAILWQSCGILVMRRRRCCCFLILLKKDIGSFKIFYSVWLSICRVKGLLCGEGQTVIWLPLKPKELAVVACKILDVNFDLQYISNRTFYVSWVFNSTQAVMNLNVKSTNLRKLF